MPEEQTRTDDSSPTTPKTIDLPIVDDDVISLRITIDVERRPQSSGNGQVHTSAAGGGSLDEKELGGRRHPSRHSTDGSQRQILQLKHLVKHLKRGDVLVVPHLDLLAGGTDASLSNEGRELIEILYSATDRGGLGRVREAAWGPAGADRMI